MPRRLIAAVIANCLVFGAAFAQKAEKPQTAVRLAAGVRAPDGAYRAAIDLTLPKGAITYWLNPGDSGVAPEFDYSASENLGSVETRLPAPLRIEHQGEMNFGYKDHALYFVRAQSAAAGAPPKIKLKMAYAICEKLCIPAEASVELDFSGPVDPVQGALVDEAEKNLPLRRDSKDLSIERLSTSDAAWLLRPKGEKVFSDLFVNGEGALFETQKQPDGAFKLRLVDAHRSNSGQILHLTALFSGEAGAVEFPLELKRDAR